MDKRDNRYNGILLFNKPTGVSSHQVVADIRRAIRQRRVGHTGTLDPLAQGLLVMCLGKATKIARFISKFDKTYEAEICFGRKSATYDGEGVYNDHPSMPAPDLNKDKFGCLLDQYKGRITQKVPAYSAVKVDGQRLYSLARRGLPVNQPEREIEIREIAFLGYHKPYLQVRITCSQGTYVRSLADDLGEKIGCGAYLSRLRRISVGALHIDRALSLSEVRQYHDAGSLHEHLLTYQAVLPYSAITVSDDFKEYVICGKALTSRDVVQIRGSFSAGDRVFLINVEGHVLAVGTADAPSDAFVGGNGQKLFTYVRVLN